MQKKIEESFEIKNTQLQVLSLIIHGDNLGIVEENIRRKFGPSGEYENFFYDDTLIIDFSNLDKNFLLQDIASLIHTLRTCGLIPFAFKSENKILTRNVSSLGLIETPVEKNQLKLSAPGSKEKVKESSKNSSLIVEKPLRSGQKIYAKECDLIVLSIVNSGAEIIADGNIHVYAPLRGKVIAGARGDAGARIFALQMDPELVSIAGIYRTSENPLPVDIKNKTAQVYLKKVDGHEKLIFEALQK